MPTNPLLRPFVKWAGGKRQLLPAITLHLPAKYGAYYEPFLGGGALLFALAPARAVVNDTNQELINCYQVVRDHVEDLIALLEAHRARNDADYYYAVRAWDREPNFPHRPAVERAARIIYLNKTCYNGLFRVNSQGQFNVPFGRSAAPNIVDAGVLRAVSGYLRANAVVFRHLDFVAATADAGPGDFIYFDPPYDPVSPTASFTGYDVNGFDREQQTRLKTHVDALAARGCHVLLSNAATPFIRDLYQGYPQHLVPAARAINSNAQRRGDIEELLVAVPAPAAAIAPAIARPVVAR